MGLALVVNQNLPPATEGLGGVARVAIEWHFDVEPNVVEPPVADVDMAVTKRGRGPALG
jgi:hypothetical protein